MGYQDRTITCSDCGMAFVFTAGEQAFYAARGFTGGPKRCPECRAKLGASKAPTVAAFADRFDGAGRRALTAAEEEARRLEHRWVGTEHLLLGLLRDAEGAGARALRRLGVELDETRAAVEYWARAVPRSVAPRGPTPGGEGIGLARRAIRTLDVAVAAAAAQSPSAAGPQHLLLALVHGQEDASPGRGVAAAILHSAGLTAERVQAAVAQVLAEDGESADEAHPYRLAEAGEWEEATRALARWREHRRQGRRYSLVLPEALFEEVERLAERQHTSVVELLRRFTRLGLLATQVQERPDAALVLREGDRERQLLLL